MKQIFIAITVLILIAGCAPAPSEPALESRPAEGEVPVIEPKPQEPKKQEDLTEKLAQEQEKRIIEEIKTVPKLPPRDRDTAIEQFWAMYAQNITSYHFKFAGKGVYYVRGDRVRFLPYSPIRLSTYTDEEGKLWRQVSIDTVYLDLAEKEAVGYCEGLWSEAINRICAELEIYDKPFKLDFEKYMVKLPHQWLLEYQDKQPVLEEHDKYYVKGRKTTQIGFSDGVKMFIDPRTGLPLKIVVKPTEMYLFEDLVANQARPEDVIHRKRSEIPQEELFYKPLY